MHDFLRELLVAAAAVFMFLSPCLLASRCASERRRPGRPYEGVDRRDPR